DYFYRFLSAGHIQCDGTFMRIDSRAWVDRLADYCTFFNIIVIGIFTVYLTEIGIIQRFFCTVIIRAVKSGTVYVCTPSSRSWSSGCTSSPVSIDWLVTVPGGDPPSSGTRVTLLNARLFKVSMIST